MADIEVQYDKKQQILLIGREGIMVLGLIPDTFSDLFGTEWLHDAREKGCVWIPYQATPGGDA